MTLRGVLLGCALLLGATLVPTATAESPLVATHDALDEGGLSEEAMELEESVRQRTLLHRMLVRPITAQCTTTWGGLPFYCLSFSTASISAQWASTRFVRAQRACPTVPQHRLDRATPVAQVESAGWVTGPVAQRGGHRSGACVYAMLSGVRL